MTKSELSFISIQLSLSQRRVREAAHMGAIRTVEIRKKNKKFKLKNYGRKDLLTRPVK